MWAAIKMEGQICCNPHPLYKLNFFALCLFVSELRVGGLEFSSFMQAYLGRWGGGGSNWTPRQVPQKHWLCMESVMYKCIKLHFHINSVHVFAILYMVDNLVEYYLVF